MSKESHELRKSLADLPHDVLADILSQLPLECILKLGLTDKYFHARVIAREPEFMANVERDFYFCYLFKHIVDTHGDKLTSPLKAYQNKSWFSLYLLACGLFSKDVNPPKNTKFVPQNEVEEDGVNIVYEMADHEEAPAAYADQLNVKELKGASVNILIQKLVSGEVDPVYQTALCSSFECFIDLTNLLKIIFHKFHNFSPFAADDPNLASKKVGLGIGILNLLRRLLVRRSDTFRAKHLRMVAKFAQGITGHDVWGPQAQLIWKALAQELAKRIEHRIPTIKVQGPLPDIPLLMRSPKILAQQLSLFMFRAYSDLTITDVFDFKKPGGSWKCFVDHFNRISTWVAAHILGTPKIKDRVKTYQFFVEFAQSLHAHKDYHSLGAVLGALSSSAIFRLRHTREEVSSKHTTELQKLEEIMNTNSRNSKIFRDTLSHTEPPCVPFLGIYYQDMSHVMDGNAPTVEKEGVILINCWKLRMCNKIISDALVFQNTKYSFEEDYEVQLYIWQRIMQKNYSEESLFTDSLRIEPRGCSRTDLE